MSHRPRKRFSQNFLRDQNIIRQIIKAIDPKPQQHFVEIGPGQGALTTNLLPLVKHMDAIEIDRQLIPLLAANCQSLGQLNILEADALTVDFHQLQTDQRLLRVIGNLPYHISTPLLFHTLQYAPIISDMHFMLQKEVVERMTASPGNKIYGRLSVMIQYYCETAWLFQVPATAFYPKPAVESAIVKLVPRPQTMLQAKDTVTFSEIVKAAFGQRRKTLRNSLKNYVTAADWQMLQLDYELRPEQLSVADFVKISNRINI